MIALLVAAVPYLTLAPGDAAAPLGFADPPIAAEFASYSALDTRFVACAGAWQETAIRGRRTWVATSPATMTFVDEAGQVRVESIAPGGGYTEIGVWTLVLNNPSALARVADARVEWFFGPVDEHLRWISMGEPCPDGSPSDGYGAGATTTPNESECWFYTEIQSVDPPATIGYKWTCDKPGASGKCTMLVQDASASGSYEGECGSSSLVITIYSQGRVFACD